MIASSVMEVRVCISVLLGSGGEKQVLQDLITIKINALLGDSAHQVGRKALVETVNALLTPSGSCQILQSAVFLGAGRTNDLALLNPRAESGDGVGEQSREQLAHTATNEVLFSCGTFRDTEFSIEQFSALVDIHLDDSGGGQQQAELQPTEKTSGTTLGTNLADLLFQVLQLADTPLHVQEHSRLQDPDWLCDQGS